MPEITRLPPGRGRLRDVGALPAVLAAAGAGRGGGDPGPPRVLVAGRHAGARRRRSPCRPACAPARRPAHPGDPLRGRGGDRGQLGHLHLGRQQRPRRRDLAGLLHQPAGDRADGRGDPRRAAAPAAVDRARHRGRRGPRLTVEYGRPPWVALALAFSFGSYGLAKKKANAGAVESLTVETMVLAPVALGYLAWLVARALGLRPERRRTHAAARDHRRGHGGPADLLRSRRDPGLHDHDRPAAVPRADPPVRARRAGLPRGHAPDALGRVRPRLGGAGDLHLRGGHPPPPPAPAGRAGQRPLTARTPPL